MAQSRREMTAVPAPHRPRSTPRRPCGTISLMTDGTDAREMFRALPWPFEGDRFPEQLGAVVAKTVLSGEFPAREVVHTPENEWAIGDGVTDPNEPGACVATHIWHVIERNSSVAEIASLPPDHIAVRDGAGQPWTVHKLEGWGDEE